MHSTILCHPYRKGWNLRNTVSLFSIWNEFIEYDVFSLSICWVAYSHDLQTPIIELIYSLFSSVKVKFIFRNQFFYELEVMTIIVMTIIVMTIMVITIIVDLSTLSRRVTHHFDITVHVVLSGHFFNIFY